MISRWLRDKIDKITSLISQELRPLMLIERWLQRGDSEHKHGSFHRRLILFI